MTDKDEIIYSAETQAVEDIDKVCAESDLNILAEKYPEILASYRRAMLLAWLGGAVWGIDRGSTETREMFGAGFQAILEKLKADING